MIKLIDQKEDILWAGTVLRMLNSPIGNLDFVVFSWFEEEYPFGLLESSGDGAGKKRFLLSADSVPKGFRAISRNWLIENWEKLNIGAEINNIAITKYDASFSSKMDMTPLVSCEDIITPGTVLRMPAQWPYEDIVDFMVFETHDDRPLGLIVTSGLKAGLVLVLLPNESIYVQSLDLGINKNWLIANWANWVYPEADVNDVYVTKYTTELPSK